MKTCVFLEEWKYFSSDNKLHGMEWGSPSQAFSTILHSLVETNMHYMWYFEFWTTTGLVNLLVSKDAETRTVHLDSGIGKLRAHFQVIHRTSLLDHPPPNPHHPQNTHMCAHTLFPYIMPFIVSWNILAFQFQVIYITHEQTGCLYLLSPEICKLTEFRIILNSSLFSLYLAQY